MTLQTAAVLPGNYIENRREYHGFRKGKYLFPCDEVCFSIRLVDGDLG